VLDDLGRAGVAGDDRELRELDRRDQLLLEVRGARPPNTAATIVMSAIRARLRRLRTASVDVRPLDRCADGRCAACGTGGPDRDESRCVRVSRRAPAPGVYSGTMSRLLVRRPSPRLAEGELTHLERVPVDPELALRQWGLRRGVPLPRLGRDRHRARRRTPTGCSSRTPWSCSATSPCSPAPARTRGAARSTRPARPSRGRDRFAAIEAPGTLDGGDVLKVGHTVYVGQTCARTPRASARWTRCSPPRLDGRPRRGHQGCT
jgi:hypothetical protein